MENFNINGDYQKKIDFLTGTQKAEKTKEIEEKNIFEDFFELEETTSKQRHDIVSEAEKVLAKTELERFKSDVNIKGLKDGMKGLEAAFKKIENPTDEQREKYEQDMLILEKEYFGRKMIISP